MPELARARESQRVISMLPDLPSSNPIEASLRNRIYLVGLRYQHHARHSGYEAFGHHVANMLPTRVKFRWLRSKWGWPINELVAQITRHPWYSLGAHLNEWNVLWHMARRRAHIYHVLYGDSDLWLMRRANRLTGNRLVATFHEPPEDLRQLRIVERICKHLDAVILVSETQRAYFEEFLVPERVFVVPHGVNTEFFHPAEKATNSLSCITVGSHLRDFQTLKEAIQLVWKSQPDLRFTAVGTRTDDKAMFPSFEDERVQFLDGIDDEALRDAYQGAGLAVFSFRSATANNAMLEAMACGLPVVATDIGGIGEYITPQAGVLCAPQSPQALAAAILSILNTPGLQQKMAAESRRRALELDFRCIAARMADIYAQILDMDA